MIFTPELHEFPRMLEGNYGKNMGAKILWEDRMEPLIFSQKTPDKQRMPVGQNGEMGRMMRG